MPTREDELEDALAQAQDIIDRLRAALVEIIAISTMNSATTRTLVKIEQIARGALGKGMR